MAFTLRGSAPFGPVIRSGNRRGPSRGRGRLPLKKECAMRRGMRTSGLAFGLLAGSLLAACGHDSTGPHGASGPPVIADINGATQPSGPTGSTVIIEGQNFANSQGSGEV